VTGPAGAAFLKMSGSGNDFLVFDSRGGVPAGLDTADRIRTLCARGTGVGADGIVFIEPSASALFAMRYHNADGSRAELCGNAALCSTRFAVEMGLVQPGDEFEFDTDSGRLRARITEGQPEIDLAPVGEVSRAAAGIEPLPGEDRIGFVLAGVPHLVIACGDAEMADVPGRGSELRRHRSLSAGANVNFVSERGDAWRYRTFERGVEAETLACGTGAVATAILLKEWEKVRGDAVQLRTSSGETLVVTLRRSGDAWLPSLRGPARIVFEGALREV
jgi:diaminopimelate epimerase